MGRTVQEIAESLQASFTAINPSLDLLVGPTYDYTMAPVPQEISSAETLATNLVSFYSPQFPTIATPEEARDFATNFGISVSGGEYARGPVVFYRTSPPPAGTTFVVNVGDLVGSVDYQFLFQSMQTVTMLGDYANTYYNPSTGRYEITVIVQAVLPGSLFNLAPNRITQIISGGSGTTTFNGVSQLVAMSGGSDAETSTDLAVRVTQQFKGINLNSITGLATLATRLVPTGILATSVVRPTDRQEFRRPTSGPSIDLCIKGEAIQPFTEEYFASGGEISITLQTTTVTAVSQVTINNSVLDVSLWSFVPDTSAAYQGSTRATPTIELVNALTAHDIVNVTGIYNFLLDEVQAVIVSGDDAIFQTDVLVRSFVDLPVTVGIQVKVLNSGIDLTTITANVTQQIINDIETNPIPSVLTANDLSYYISSTISNIVFVNLYEFRRTNSSISTIENIVPLKNQAPVFDVASSSIVVSF